MNLLIENPNPFSISDSDLKNLMEHLKMYKYRCILDKPKPIDCVCNGGMILLHMAIAYKDMKLIKFLSKNSHNVKSKNSFGNRAFVLTLQSYNFEAVKILLGADAGVCVTDSYSGTTALELLMKKKRKYISDIVPNFVKNLKRNKFEFAPLVEIVSSARCSLEYVYLMNDDQSNREVLKRNVSDDLDLNMTLAMERRDFQNVEMIMRYGNLSGKSTFYKNLSDFCTTDRFELWKAFIERFINWNLISIETLTHFDSMFRTANAKYLQIILKCGIHEQLKEKFQVDLRVSMFGNPWIDAMELLRKQNFKVNTRSLEQESALHIAVKNNLVKNVSILLDSGADPNIKDERGRTALFDCTHEDNIKCAKLLLAHGANVQVTDKHGLSLFEDGQDNYSVMNYLIAQLAIDVLKGVSVKQEILDQIHSNTLYQNVYEECFEELTFLNKWTIATPVMMESVETYPTSKYVSFFTVLTDNIEQLYRHIFENHVRIQDVISLLDQCNGQYNRLHWFYYSTLQMKLIKASNLYHFKCYIADVISKSTGKFIGFDHLATRNISNFLTDRDIELFVYSFR